MTRIVIVGAGGQGTIVADMLHDAAGFVDDTAKKIGTNVLGLPVLGPIAALRDIEHDAVIVAIGENRARRAITERLLANGERLATAIHPFAYVAASATIGGGCMISAGALILPRTMIGIGVIVNTKASIDHDCAVGDFAHVAVGATLGGRIRIGAETLIAAGATVVSGTSVGARTVIGAGAVVIRDVPDDVVALGVPARVTSDRRSETSGR